MTLLNYAPLDLANKSLNREKKKGNVVWKISGKKEVRDERGQSEEEGEREKRQRGGENGHKH